MKIEEVKPFLDFLGIDIDKAASVDELKAAHTGNFISKANIETEVNADKKLQASIFGKRLGSLQTKLEQGFKANGIELKPDEIKDKSVEDIFELGIKKQVDLSLKAIDEAKGAAGEPAKAVKEWQDKYNQLETKFNGEVKLKQDLQQQFEGYKTEIATKEKTGKINQYKEDGWKNFKWDSVTAKDPFRMEGFRSTIEKKYKIQLDDKGEPFPTNDKGERIPSSKKAGEWKNWAEILEEEGMAAKVYAAADNKGGRAAPMPRPQPTATGGAPSPGIPEPFVHPSARKAAEIG